MSQRIAPGIVVRHPERPDWGIGQVQSAIGNRVTVNFEHAGKRLINSDVVSLDTVDLDPFSATFNGAALGAGAEIVVTQA